MSPGRGPAGSAKGGAAAGMDRLGDNLPSAADRILYDNARGPPSGPSDRRHAKRRDRQNTRLRFPR